VKNLAKNAMAFTLVEVMIVVGIISILSAIAIPFFSKIRHEAQVKEAESSLEIMASAVLQLAWDTGEWPGGLARAETHSEEAWYLGGGDVGLLSQDGRFSEWKGPYLAEVPLDPWKMPYFFDPDYRVNGIDKVVVGSFGPNRKGRNHYDQDDVFIVLD
jgi:prepilin-type N-terminal cleavage/methylation domain-containing protein